MIVILKCQVYGAEYLTLWNGKSGTASDRQAYIASPSFNALLTMAAVFFASSLSKMLTR